MYDTKTVQIIKSLTKGEQLGLKHFLNNPFFNKNEELKKLTDFIYSFAPGFKGSNFTKESTFKNVFPNKTYDQKQINHLLNKLNTKIDKFLSFLELNQNQVDVELKVLEFHQRKDTKYFENQFNRIKKLLNGNKIKGGELLEVNQKMEYLLATYYSSVQPHKERNLKAVLLALDNTSMFKKLSIICDMLNHSLITKLFL